MFDADDIIMFTLIGGFVSVPVFLAGEILLRNLFVCT